MSIMAMENIRRYAVVVPVFMASLAFGQTPPSITLVPSNYHGYQISCFGSKDGTIDATVTGGTPPYTYIWSTGDSIEDLDSLPSGYYDLRVTDSNGKGAEADITLVEPTAMALVAEPYVFPNGYNISCYECYNGSIDVTVSQGVPPYTYVWSDSVIAQDRSGLGAKKYIALARDANHCKVHSETIMLTQPDRDVWSMEGDSGTTPGSQYIGTSDAKDLVLKTNGAERLRLKANGDIGLWGADTTAGPLYRDWDGILKVGGGPFSETFPVTPTYPCYLLNAIPYWQTGGNDFTDLCPQQDPLLGTLSARPLKIVTNGEERVRITTDGKVGIGTIIPEASLHVQGDMLVRGGSNGEGDLVTSADTTTGAVLWARNSQAAWGLSIDPSGKGHILGDWNNPHPIMTFTYDKVGIGTTPPDNSNYRLFVEGGISTRDVLVKLGDWPDYVFQPNYALMPLDEMRDYLRINKHLPGIPAAAELEAKQGVEVGDLQARMLKVVEEQALYILQLEEKQEGLEQRIQALEAVQH